MSESTHLKCPCQHCGSSIEFPAHGVGLIIDCPHCSAKTLLSQPSAIAAHGANDFGSSGPGTPPPSDSGALTDDDASRMVERIGRSRVWPFVVVFSGVVGTIALLQLRKNLEKPPVMGSPTPTQTLASNVAATPATALEARTPTQPKATRSVDDLKVGPIKLEKAKGSSLVYAVGVMKNASDFQRFGVTIELELTDAGGRKVGTAKDYHNVIEPRQEWRFRALVLDSKAEAARVAQIREEE